MKKILLSLLFPALCLSQSSQNICNSNTVNITEVMNNMSASDLITAGATIAKYVLQSRGGPKYIPVKPHSEIVEKEISTDYILACNEKCFIINNYNIYKLEDFLTLEFEKDKENIIFVKTYSGFFSIKENYFLVNIFFKQKEKKWSYTHEEIDLTKEIKIPSNSVLHFAHPKH